MQNQPFAPDRISDLLGKATTWFGLDHKISRITGFSVLLAAALYFISVIMFQTGPINCWGADTHILLDGAWRILSGQVPYRDFYLALGPVDYSTVAFGMLLTHASPQGIAVGNAIFGMVVGIWGWFLCRRRMPFVPTVIVTTWLILTATAPSPLGAPAHVITCAMIYNRHGYAILSLVLLESAFANERGRFWGGFSSGAALIVLLFLKLNFFFAAILLLGATIPFRRVELERMWGALLGAAFAFLAFVLYLRFAIIAFFHDMRYAIQSRIGGVQLGSTLRLGFSSIEMITAVTLTVLTLMLVARGRDWNRFAIRLSLLAIAMIGGSLVLRRTDYGESGYQLAILWTIILIVKLAESYPAAQQKVAISAVILMATGVIFIRLAHDASSLLALLEYQAPPTKSQAARILGMEHMGYYDVDIEILSQFRFETGTAYVDYINDGLYLLKKWSRPDESILTLGYNNPFPYILRRRPAFGGSPWLHEGNDISRDHPLAAERLFGDAALVMVPRMPSSHQDSDLDLQVIYHPYLQQHFSLVAKSDWWSLYRRKDPNGVAEGAPSSRQLTGEQLARTVAVSEVELWPQPRLVERRSWPLPIRSTQSR
jgi:hypothetical protein